MLAKDLAAHVESSPETVLFRSEDGSSHEISMVRDSFSLPDPAIVKVYTTCGCGPFTYSISGDVEVYTRATHSPS